MKTARQKSGYIAMDLAEQGEEARRAYSEAGEAIDLAANAKVVGDAVPAFSVAIDKLLETVKILSGMVAEIAYEGSAEVQRTREEIARVKGEPTPLTADFPIPGKVVFAPYDGNMH